jgi:glycosyltransferase involved in cell wall biosynthesis
VPHFNAPWFSRGPLVVTIHDLIYLREPGSMTHPLGRLYVRAMLSRACRRACAVLTVSQATKNDLIALLPGIDPGRITVTYEAASEIFRPNPPAAAEGGVDRTHFQMQKPYVLFVGSLKPHKNIPLLTRAIRKLRSDSGLDVEAAIVGRPDPKHPEILKDVEAGEGVRYLGAPSDEALVQLYAGASALVLPSFSEGFGLPALEAMACGTPVLLSRRGSLPEIGGAAARYFEPDRVDGLCELLYTIFKNKDLRKEMSRMSLSQAAQFTWERTARQTLAAYDRIWI